MDRINSGTRRRTVQSARRGPLNALGRSISSFLGTAGSWIMAIIVLAMTINVLPLTANVASASSAVRVTFDQCANGAGSGPCNWINGNLVKSNSTYSEGDSTPQRVILGNLTPGSTHWAIQSANEL